MGHNTPQFGERAAYGPNDVCFKHRDRPTFTLCQRCGNNICTDCQTQSAVGVLCPDCMKLARGSAAAAAGRRATSTMRVLRDDQTPVITYSIIALCVIIFVGQRISSTVTDALLYAPVYSLPEQFEPWRMLTVMFTHSPSNVIHILGNMFALWIFGRTLELQLGRWNYTLLFMASGWGGSVFVQLWGYTSIEALTTPTVGASGAIFGIVGATFVALRHMNVNITSLAVIIAINLGIGFMPGVNISWQAHLGGLIVGAAFMALMLKFRGPRQKTKRVIALTAVFAVLAVLSAAYWFVHPISILA